MIWFKWRILKFPNFKIIFVKKKTNELKFRFALFLVLYTLNLFTFCPITVYFNYFNIRKKCLLTLIDTWNLCSSCHLCWSSNCLFFSWNVCQSRCFCSSCSFLSFKKQNLMTKTINYFLMQLIFNLIQIQTIVLFKYDYVLVKTIYDI